MTLEKIAEEAASLNEKQRAALAASLLDTLPPPGLEIGDEVVDQREEELDSGKVQPISHEELVRRVQGERQP